MFVVSPRGGSAFRCLLLLPKFSASDPSRAAEILARSHFDDRNNSEMSAVLPLFPSENSKACEAHIARKSAAWHGIIDMNIAIS
jgi:hypothetical protein